MFRPDRIRLKVLFFCFWFAVYPTLFNVSQARGDERKTRELTEEVLPAANIEETAANLRSSGVLIYPSEYLKDQLKILGRNKDEIAARFLVFLPSEMGGIFTGLDVKGGGLEILTLYLALNLTFNVASGKTDILADIAGINQYKSDTLDRFKFYKGLADSTARFAFAGWLFRKSELSQKLGAASKSFLDLWEEVETLEVVLAKYSKAKAFRLTEDTCDLVVEGFKSVDDAPGFRVMKGINDVLGFVDVAFAAFNFATEKEWGYLFRDGQMTYKQVKVSIDLASAILGLSCLGLAPWATIALLLVSLVLVGTDIYSDSLRNWVINFIDCHKVLAECDPTFNSIIGEVDQKWSGSFAQKVYSTLARQRRQYPNELHPSDTVKQIEGLQDAIISRYRVCRHYNSFNIGDIDFRKNLHVIAEKWKTKAEAQSDWWWWPQFNPFATRQEAAESQYFSSWHYDSARIGNDAARWCYFNYDFFLIKLFQQTLNDFESSPENTALIENSPIIHLVQNRIQIAPFHYFPMVLNLMGFFNAGDKIDSLEKFIYLCQYSYQLDLIITAIKESCYFTTYLTAIKEQFSDLSRGMEEMRDTCFGLKTENADYIKGAANLKEIVCTSIDEPEKELSSEKFSEYKRNLALEKPDAENMNYKGLIAKNSTKINAILSLLPLKALSVSAKIALLKVLVKQHFVRRAFLTACLSRFTSLEIETAKPEPIKVEPIEGLGAPQASFPPGKAFLEANVTVNSQDETGLSHSLNFDFSAGGYFWNAGSNLLFVFKDNMEQMRDAHEKINRSLEWMELLITRGGYYSNTDISLDKLNQKCGDILKCMYDLTRKHEDSPCENIEITYPSSEKRIYLTEDRETYKDFDVSDSIPRVFTIPDLVFSVGRPGPMDEIPETGVPDFYELMMSDPKPIENIITLPGMTITP
ncbi:MAG: hypothetical protein AB1403_05420 [Candidatus Riflebacteria bacterium]